MRVVKPRGILIRVRTSSGREWDEVFHKRTNSVCRWAKETIKNFNDTLREGEEPREIIRVEELPEGDKRIPPLQHVWQKTNLTTQIKRDGGSFDAYRCEECGATGKKMYLDGGVILDKKCLWGKPCTGMTTKRRTTSTRRQRRLSRL